MTRFNILYYGETCYLSQFDASIYKTRKEAKIADVYHAAQKLVLMTPLAVSDSIRRQSGDAYDIIQFLNDISDDYEVEISAPPEPIPAAPPAMA